MPAIASKVLRREAAGDVGGVVGFHGEDGKAGGVDGEDEGRGCHRGCGGGGAAGTSFWSNSMKISSGDVPLLDTPPSRFRCNE